MPRGRPKKPVEGIIRKATDEELVAIREWFTQKQIDDPRFGYSRPAPKPGGKKKKEE